MFFKYTYNNAHTIDEQGRLMVFELKDNQKKKREKKLPILKFYDLDKQKFLRLDPSRIIREVKEIRPGYYALYDHLGMQTYSLVMPYASDNTYIMGEDEIQVIDCIPREWYRNDEDSTAYKLPRDIKEAEELLVKIYDESGSCGYELIDYVKGNTSTLEYAFDKINKDTYVSVLTSNDGKVRLYTWDTHTGGTSPNFAAYVQYDDGKSINVRCFTPLTSSKYVCERDAKCDGYETYDGAWIDCMYQIDQPSGSPVYLASAYNKASSSEGAQDVVAMQIIDGKLQKIPFIDKDGKQVRFAGCYYSIPDWYFTTDGLDWDWVPSFDNKTNTLYIPEDGSMKMSDRYEMYKLIDGKMKYVGNGAGFWLHLSLHDFKRLCGIYQTKTKLIRIDLLADGQYRYASWSKKNAMDKAPELVIVGAKTDVIENALVFEKDGYQYIVPAYRHGSGDDFGKFIIKKNGKVIQESKV